MASHWGYYCIFDASPSWDDASSKYATIFQCQIWRVAELRWRFQNTVEFKGFLIIMTEVVINVIFDASKTCTTRPKSVHSFWTRTIYYNAINSKNSQFTFSVMLKLCLSNEITYREHYKKTSVESDEILFDFLCSSNHTFSVIHDIFICNEHHLCIHCSLHWSAKVMYNGVSNCEYQAGKS